MNPAAADMSHIKLRFPAERDEEAVNVLDALFAKEDFNFSLRRRESGGVKDVEPWAEYLQRVRAEARGTDLPEGRVPAEFLLAELHGEIIGRVSIRLALTDHLHRVGGHIGYGVAPTHRRRGYATTLLRMSIERLCARWERDGVAGAHEERKILVTCEDGNVGSYKAIEACGGVLENRVAHEGALLRRYWI